MEKNGDSLLPYLGSEGISDHQRFQGSSTRARFVSRQPGTPATKASTLQHKGILREITCPPVPLESRRSQLPREPLEPDDMPHDMTHMKQELFTKRHSRVGCLFLCIFTPLTYNARRCPHLPLREMKAFSGDLRPWNLHEGVLVFNPSGMPLTNTFDNIPMAPHK